jgi:hypothetical protein
LKNLEFREEIKRTKIEFKEFLVLFVTISLLIFFAIHRFSFATKMVNKEKAKRTVGQIIGLEKQFEKEHGRYGTLSEIGFSNPFRDNSVEFNISFVNGFIVQAKENPLFDSFGDNISGNEYFIGYPNGAVEYNRKN